MAEQRLAAGISTSGSVGHRWQSNRAVVDKLPKCARCPGAKSLANLNGATAPKRCTIAKRVTVARDDTASVYQPNMGQPFRAMSW